MSTLLYESLTTAREVTPSGSAPELHRARPGGGARGARIPTRAVSQTTKPADKGPVTMTITDEGAATLFWCLLLVAAIALYAVPHVVKHGWDTTDFVRALIPAAAFAAWTMVEKATLFDALTDWDNVQRIGIGVALALIALVASKAFADKAQEKTPDPEQVAAVAGR